MSYVQALRPDQPRRGRRAENGNGTEWPASKDVLLPSDNTVSSFWITNPDNTYRDNVAAGSDANGFWMSLPEHPNGQFEGTEISKATWPRRTPFREFKGNVAHSNYDAFMFDRNIAANNTFGVTGSSHTGLENPADPNSKALESVFENLTAYKNRNGGIWGRGEMHVFRNVKLADNAMGFTHASGAFGRYAFTSQVVDSLFVGETENIGNPTTDAEKAYGRSLPKPELPDFPIRGYEYYDYRHDVVNTTFRNYEDNATRKTGAISNLLFSSFGVSTNNAFERLKFVNAKPVYFPPMANNSKWASDNGGSTSYKTAAFRDKDGSLGGGPNSYVLIHDGVNDSIAVDAEACEIKPTWNAAVCKGDVGRLTFGGPGGPSAAADSAALGAQVPEEPAVPVRARLVLVRQPVLADLLLRLAVLVPARLAVLVQRPVLADPLLVGGRSWRIRRRCRWTSCSAASRSQPQWQGVHRNRGTNVRAGTEIKVTTERPSVPLTLTELDRGSWVIFELPGFTTAASGAPQDSLDALRKASDTSYFKDKDALWVKVVSSGDAGNGAPGGGTSVQVSR